MQPLSLIGGSIAAAVAILVLFRRRRGAGSWSFASGMLLLALMEFWPDWRPLFFAFAPVAFLIFSLSFARVEARLWLRKWRWVVAASALTPAAVLAAAGAGRVFYTVVLLIAVLVAANLERTLRSATGYLRWQVKFVVLGTSCICVSWIYVSSQAVLYADLSPSIWLVHPAMLIMGSAVMALGLRRSHFLNVNFYVSRATIQYSMTALLAGAYLVVVGILAQMARYYGAGWLLPLDALLVLFGLVGLGLLLLSDRVREHVKRFVTRHFRRPLYDYRKAWMDLTEQTSAITSVEALCGAVAAIISQTFSILSVSVWLCDEAKESLVLAGSTVFSPARGAELSRSGDEVSKLLEKLEKRAGPMDLEDEIPEWAAGIMSASPEYFSEYKMRYIVPIRTAGLLVGILTLNGDRVGQAPLSLEDQDLLNAYAAQLGARVLQLRVSEELRKAQEIEAFQHVTTFFVHDLKNVAARLSLTLQNLPAYFDNPEFRSDALRVIRESVAKIDETISRLSAMRRIEINRRPADLNAIVENCLADFERSTRMTVDREFGALPELSIDAEQIQKVVTNLVMNAYDATGGSGIRASTWARDRHVMLAIEDHGCGMSRQFMEKKLFRPFSSTKKRGIGIGLFQSRIIVEAHKGRIEVDSEEGKGTTFRVLLPVSSAGLEPCGDAARPAAGADEFRASTGVRGQQQAVGGR